MTKERFIELLNDPERLANISYEELKTIVLAYPYAHALRYLLAIKANQISHPEAARALSGAAAYSLDRKRLFQLLAPPHLAPQAMTQKEEVLQLKSIESVKQALEALSPVPRAAAETPAEKVQALDNESIVPVAAPAPVLAPSPAPTPPAAFNSFSGWMSQFTPPALPLSQQQPTNPAQEADELQDLAAEPAPPVRQGRTAQHPEAQRLAERSLSENQELVTETLARLYIAQGHREKAIKMYQRLILKYPEKSANFAAEIEKLKNKTE
jgi:tetratricopeptide (TPR) repeat protein